MDEKTYNRYLFEYRFEGAVWGFEVLATSPDEAMERLKAIGWAQYKGEIFAKITASTAPFTNLTRRVLSLMRLR